MPEIARELNVDALIEGTAARSGNRLRVTVNLVQASPEKHLWAESYESDIGDAFALQNKIALAVARQIRIRLTPREQNLLSSGPPTLNSDAQDAYLRGWVCIPERRHGGFIAQSRPILSARR